MHIDSLSFPVSIWVNYYHNNKRTNNEINVVNTRTNILYIHGCHTRTNHKKMSDVTHVIPILETFSIITQSLNSDAKISVGTQKCCIFIHLSLHHSSHFITPLTFHDIIFINIFGFHLIIFHFIHFSIKREFVIKY
jgi:hypothetical protein